MTNTDLDRTRGNMTVALSIMAIFVAPVFWVFGYIVGICSR